MDSKILIESSCLFVKAKSMQLNTPEISWCAQSDIFLLLEIMGRFVWGLEEILIILSKKRVRFDVIKNSALFPLFFLMPEILLELRVVDLSGPSLSEICGPDSVSLKDYDTCQVIITDWESHFLLPERIKKSIRNLFLFVPLLTVTNIQNKATTKNFQLNISSSIIFLLLLLAKLIHNISFKGIFSVKVNHVSQKYMYLI